MKIDEKVSTRVPPLRRRDLMKMGVGAGVAAMAQQVLNAPSTSAQETPDGSAQGQSPAAPRRAGVFTETGAGWKNDANRASGNGPIDDTTRQIVGQAHSLSESILTAPVLDALGNILVDTLAALIGGFESEPSRICARVARLTQQSELKSTVLGYGVTTSPELAAFANGCMVRIRDFNDQGPGTHPSDILSGILAVAEALHSSGTQTLTAVALGYELTGALSDAGRASGWDSWQECTAVALASAKLMGLNEDQMANALSLAMVPHMPMNVTHIGHLSHWKGVHAPEANKSAVWAALLARAGMCGPSKPFEARDGLFDHIGMFKKEVRLPFSPDGQWSVQRVDFKRCPGVSSIQSTLEMSIPQIRAWTKAEDIESIHEEIAFTVWQESADPPKWDPRNQETADHSHPYIISRALIDGEIYLDSYTQEKIMDPAVRRLMANFTVAPTPDLRSGQTRLIVHKKGEPVPRQFDANPKVAGTFQTRMTREDVIAKFKRVCAFRHVADDQRDRALEQWFNLSAVKDIEEPMRNLAHFGRPQPL